MEIDDGMRMRAFNEKTGFRGLWLSRRNGVTVWTITFLEDGDIAETEDHEDWRAAVDDFFGRLNRAQSA